VRAVVECLGSSRATAAGNGAEESGRQGIGEVIGED